MKAINLHTMSRSRLLYLLGNNTIKPNTSALLSISDQPFIIDKSWEFKYYKQVCFEDCGISYPQAINSKIISEIVDFLKSITEANDLYIHCMAGQSRSPAIATLASVILNKDVSLEEAIRIAKKSCYESSVGPNNLVLSLSDILLNCNGEFNRLAQLVFRKEKTI